MKQLNTVTGIADLRIQQPFNQPKLFIDVDRTKTLQAGFTQRERRRKYSGLPERQLSDFAFLLAGPEIGRQLQRGDAIAAIQF